MPKEFGRNRRVADLVQRELATIIQRDNLETNLGLITVSTVDVSPDLKNAKIYITAMGSNLNMEDLIFSLNERAGHFRHELAKTLQLRYIPRISFIYDKSIERGNHLSALIDSLNTGEK